MDKSVSLSTKEHPEGVYSLVSVKQCYWAATIMRNNLHKSQVAARVRFRPLAYNHHFVYILALVTRAKSRASLSRT